jgi:hypothetical protein
VEELTAALKFAGATPVTEEAVVPNPDEALGEDVEEEASNELFGGKSHRSLAVAVAVVAPEEGDVSILHLEEPMVGDGDAMGIAAEIIEGLFGSGKGSFGVNAPFFLAGLIEESMERLGVGKGVEFSRKLELSFAESRLEESPEASAEETGKDPDGKEEVVACRDPAIPFLRESARRDDTMDMRVEEEVLCPGVEDGGEADLGSQMFRIGRDGPKSGRDGLEEEVVNDLLVVEGEGAEGVGKCEDDVEVRDRQEFAPPGLEPFGFGQGLTLGAVPVAAGVVGDHLVVAMVAPIEMSPQGGGPALLDSAHDLPLLGIHRLAELAAIVFSVLAEDVRDFQTWLAHVRARDLLQGQGVERTGDLLDAWDGNVGVLGRGRDTLVSQEDLNHPQVGPRLEQVCGEAVTQGVRGRLFGESRRLPGAFEDLAHGRRGEGFAGILSREEPDTRFPPPPILAQDKQQTGREHDVAVSAPFPLFDSDGGTLAVDVLDLEPDYFGGAQSRSIGGHEKGSIFHARESFEELNDFFLAENDGKFMLPFGVGDGLDDSRPLEGSVVDASQGADGDVEMTGGNPLLLDEVKEVLSNLFWAEVLGRLPEVLGKGLDGFEIPLLRVGREIAKFHVLDHALT